MTSSTTTTEIYFSRKEAAAYLNCSWRSLATWDCKGTYDFKPIKIGKKMVRYRKSVLDEFMRERTRP
jgi:Helix-turn-helix domain